MASVISRPPQVCSIGGTIAVNEIVYRLSSVLNFETLEIKNQSNNATLFSVRASVVNGEAYFEISKLLSGLFANYTFNQFIRVYATGAGFTDIANIINVVNASQNRLNADFSSLVNVVSIAPTYRILNKLPIYNIGNRASISFAYRRTTDISFSMAVGGRNVITTDLPFNILRGVANIPISGSRSVNFEYRTSGASIITNTIPIQDIDICPSFILGWLNKNGGVDIFPFQYFEEGIEVVQNSSYLPYGTFQRRVISKQSQKKVTLFATITNEELIAMQDLLTSNLVVNFNADLVTYIEMQVTASNLKQLTSYSNLHDIEIELLYPIQN